MLLKGRDVIVFRFHLFLLFQFKKYIFVLNYYLNSLNITPSSIKVKDKSLVREAKSWEYLRSEKNAEIYL